MDKMIKIPAKHCRLGESEIRKYNFLEFSKFSCLFFKYILSVAFRTRYKKPWWGKCHQRYINSILLISNGGKKERHGIFLDSRYFWLASIWGYLPAYCSESNFISNFFLITIARFELIEINLFFHIIITKLMTLIRKCWSVKIG